LSIVILTIFTFIVRLKFPVGNWAFRIQLANFSHYGFAFYAGILAQRGDWFNRLTKKQARQWGLVALITMPLIFVLMIAGGLLENTANIVKFFGGMHWQAFGYVIWETILFISISVFLLYFFRERFSKAGRLARFMAGNVYTVYIIHLTLLWVLNIIFLSVDIPTILKFFIVSLITIPLSFALSALIRKIPYAKSVLG
jgi:surface polysaccharide O-acyltransferase-like enzyme